MSLKDTLLSALSVKATRVEVPGFPVHVRPMTLAERLKFQAYLNETKGKERPDLLRRALGMSICDESGTLLFAESEWLQLDALEGRAADKILEVVFHVNGFEADEKKG